MCGCWRNGLGLCSYHAEQERQEAPLADWERDLLYGTIEREREPEYREGEGKVIFTRTDGRTVEIDHVRVDSVGPNAERPGVVGVEYFNNDDVTHLPFIESWRFEY